MPSRFFIHYVSKSRRPRSGHRTGKSSSQFPKGSTKGCANHQTIALISHASKVMLKILTYYASIIRTKNFQMSKLGLEKEEELEIKLPAFTVL